MIGNKNDLLEERIVEKEQAEQLSKEIKAIEFLETSAKFGENVENAFRLIINQALTNLGLSIQ